MNDDDLCKAVLAKVATVFDLQPGHPLPAEIVWMPPGAHEICAHRMGGGTWQGSVVCDASGAAAVQRSFEEMQRAGQRLWIDCLHNDGEAAAWVLGFFWDAARGIVCKVEWTSLGAQMLREKRLYSFSPAFFVNRETGRVAGLLHGHAAGGLVNAPAFGAAMPALIAASRNPLDADGCDRLAGIVSGSLAANAGNEGFYAAVAKMLTEEFAASDLLNAGVAAAAAVGLRAEFLEVLEGPLSTCGSDSYSPAAIVSAALVVQCAAHPVHATNGSDDDFDDEAVTATHGPQ